ncbi:hypothetical protein [Nocardia sp. NPDC006630]|uniref:hypothetical protein n=1 Tax=Nocardia sp. NPDC006630 TaxID=3157181 RepID=UPI0033A79424
MEQGGKDNRLWPPLLIGATGLAVIFATLFWPYLLGHWVAVQVLDHSDQSADAKAIGVTFELPWAVFLLWLFRAKDSQHAWQVGALAVGLTLLVSGGITLGSGAEEARPGIWMMAGAVLAFALSIAAWSGFAHKVADSIRSPNEDQRQSESIALWVGALTVTVAMVVLFLNAALTR